MTSVSAKPPTVPPVVVPPLVPLWLRVLALLPLPVLYALTGALVWLTQHVVRFRLKTVRENIAACFPELTAREHRRIVDGHYRNVGQMVAEVVYGARMDAAELARRVRLVNPELPREWLSRGKPLMLMAAHQANWEWLGNALVTQLGWPLDVGYKPVRSLWVERALFALRSRFGAHMVPAKDLLADLLRRKSIVRGIAMVADQAPTSSDHRHWATFLGRDTAFYMGAEQIVRGTRYPALYLSLRRLARGRYEIEFKPLAEAGEGLRPGEFTDRYARWVEADIRAAPGDWTWGHKRWKALKPRVGDAGAG
jgi:KDO2-lipid IV(A) lauroyltransferase